MKERLLPAMLCFALILSFCPAWAQEAEKEKEAGGNAPAVQQAQEAQDHTVLARQAQDAASGWINRIIGYISQIGAIFGKTKGLRIGGTTGTAVAALAAAILLKNKISSLVKWLLYLAVGVMFAGGGANVVQLVMRYLPQ